MQTRSRAIKIRSGKVIYRKFSVNNRAKPSPLCGESISGIRAVTKIIKMIIILNAIIRYLNFNRNAPIIEISAVLLPPAALFYTVFAAKNVSRWNHKR